MFGALKVGMKLHAMYGADGKFYASEVVSLAKKKNPVKVHYIGYAATNDAWVSMDMLKYKQKKVVAVSKNTESQRETAAWEKMHQMETEIQQLVERQVATHVAAAIQKLEARPVATPVRSKFAEDFTAAMDAVNVALNEMRARMEATMTPMTAEISAMRLDIGDIQKALKNHDVSNSLQKMQEKDENLTADIVNLKGEMNTKLDTKVDNVAWKEAHDHLDATVKTVCDMVSSLRFDVDAHHHKVNEILATVRHDITAVETNLQESKAKISDTDRAVNALNGRIDFTNMDLAATQNLLSDCLDEVAVGRSELERIGKDMETRLNDIRQPLEIIGGVKETRLDALETYGLQALRLLAEHDRSRYGNF